MPNFKEILRPILKKFYVIIWRLSYWSIFRPRTKSRLLVLKERVIILVIFITWNIFQNCDVRSDICSYVVSTTPLQLNCKIQSSANISWSWEYVNPSAYFGQRKYGNIFCFNWYSVLKVTSGNARGTTSHMDGKCPTNIECFQMAGIALDICVLGGWCSWWKTIPRSGTKNSKSPLFHFPFRFHLQIWGARVGCERDTAAVVVPPFSFSIGITRIALWQQLLFSTSLD